MKILVDRLMKETGLSSELLKKWSELLSTTLSRNSHYHKGQPWTLNWQRWTRIVSKKIASLSSFPDEKVK